MQKKTWFPKGKGCIRFVSSTGSVLVIYHAPFTFESTLTSRFTTALLAQASIWVPNIFFAAIGKIVTSLLGLYKLGFTLGVGGIAYSAYSLVKVGRSLRCVPYTLLRTTTSRQGKN